jgi:hypothetical protein
MTEDLMGAAVAQLGPELVSPVVAWLAHEDVPVTGEVFTVGGGRVARFFVGMTPGYYNPKLTLEDVRDHFDEIRDESGYTVPSGPSDELGLLLETIQAG